MFQRLLNEPDNHQWYLTILFAPRLVFEQQSWSFSASVSMHPWAKRLWTDLALTRHVNDGLEFYNTLQGHLRNLLWDEDVGRSFVDLDLSQVAPEWFNNEIPPPLPYHDDEISDAEDPTHGDTLENFRCRHLLEDGSECRRTFRFLKTLKCHRRFKSYVGEHCAPVPRAMIMRPECSKAKLSLRRLHQLLSISGRHTELVTA